MPSGTTAPLRVSARVSMKSGLEDRNNPRHRRRHPCGNLGLNEVRPGRPEQFVDRGLMNSDLKKEVSMKSGLEDRNNPSRVPPVSAAPGVSMKSGLEDRNNIAP